MDISRVWTGLVMHMSALQGTSSVLYFAKQSGTGHVLGSFIFVQDSSLFILVLHIIVLGHPQTWWRLPFDQPCHKKYSSKGKQNLQVVLLHCFTCSSQSMSAWYIQRHKTFWNITHQHPFRNPSPRVLVQKLWKV